MDRVFAIPMPWNASRGWRLLNRDLRRLCSLMKGRKNVMRGLMWRFVLPRGSFSFGPHGTSTRATGSQNDAKLVQVLQQIGKRAIHAKRAGVVEFLIAVPAGQDTDAQHARSPCGDVIPHGVADYDAILGARAQALPARQK